MTAHHTRRRVAAVGAATLASALAATTVVWTAQASPSDSRTTAPTTTVDPYLRPVARGVHLRSHLTVNDLPARNGYDMVGIPDGMGAFRKDGRVVTYLNHELDVADGEGIVRAHGEEGAFVSRLVINPETGAVVKGRDLIRSVRYWDYPAGTYSDAPGAPEDAVEGHTAAFSRFCSAYLTSWGQLYSETAGVGTRERVYFANEESGDEGRVFGVLKWGRAVQLPRLGLLSWENTLAAYNATKTTVVMGNDDENPGELRVYVGTKRASGSVVQKAGLTNGKLFVVDAVNESVTDDAEFRAAFGKGHPARVTFGSDERIDWTQSGLEQDAEAAAKGLSLNRIEDGAFDPNHKNDYYFLTTEGGSTEPSPYEPGVDRDGGGLWRLRFRNVEHPELGGTLTLMLDGSERPYLNKPDNMTIDYYGNLLVQEDPGGNDHLARIVAYNIRTGARGVLARFDRALFGVTNPAGVEPDDRAVLTTDEESSGIIPTDKLFGQGTFMFDAEVHTQKTLPPGTGPGTVEEYVELGQLLIMKVDSWGKVYTIG
ncbi:hypothetical protein BH18ACT8_BH18ACT8_17660 [soil metagenome]